MLGTADIERTDTGSKYADVMPVSPHNNDDENNRLLSRMWGIRGPRNGSINVARSHNHMAIEEINCATTGRCTSNGHRSFARSFCR